MLNLIRLLLSLAVIAAASSIACSADTPAQDKTSIAKVESALDSATILEFVDTPLNEIRLYLQDLHKIPIRFDAPSLQAAGVSSEVQVTCNLKGVTLHSALEFVLAEHKLVYVIDGSGVLITAPKAKDELVKHGAIDPQTLPMPNRDKGRTKVAAALDSPTAIEFVDTPLKDVCDYLQDLHKVPVHIDMRALNTAGLSPEMRITANHRALKLQRALKLILSEQNLIHVIDGSGLLITTPAAKAALLKHRAIDPETYQPPNSDALKRRLGEVLEQPIRLKLNGVTATNFLQAVSKETKLTFLFDRDRFTLRNLAFEVSIDAQNEPLKAVFKKVFAGRQLEFGFHFHEVLIGPRSLSGRAQPWEQIHDDDVGADERASVAELKRLHCEFSMNGYGRVHSLEAASPEVLAIIPKLEDLWYLRIIPPDKSKPAGRHVARVTWMTDAQMPLLSPGIQLSSLDLSNTAIGDDGLKSLATLKRLGMLSLPNTRVTDDGLTILQAMPAIK